MNEITIPVELWVPVADEFILNQIERKREFCRSVLYERGHSPIRDRAGYKEWKMLPKSFYCLIATLNGCSILSNICSGIFVCRVYNIRQIVYYRILALESLLITLFSTLSFIANVLSLVGYVRTDKEAWSCAIVCGTATMSVMIGMVCSALASFYR